LLWHFVKVLRVGRDVEAAVALGYHVLLDPGDGASPCGAGYALAVGEDDEVEVFEDCLEGDICGEAVLEGDGEAVGRGHVGEVGGEGRWGRLLGAEETFGGGEFRGRGLVWIDVGVAVGGGLVLLVGLWFNSCLAGPGVGWTFLLLFGGVC